jgi:hypothetical protein
MQQRVSIKKFKEFPDAQAAKDKLSIEHPENTYKVRRISTGFQLVRRFKVNEIKAAEIPNPRKKRRRARDRRVASV